jgi:homoserine O-succinyltransferase
MPDSALKATERQFLNLLGSAAGGLADGLDVIVSLYALPDIPRTESGRLHISRFYSGVNDLWNAPIDALIVTGAEPRADNLNREPYWQDLAKVVDWAEENTHSTIWSCLAAHAALQHADGIARRRLPDKRYGVFECVRTADHELTAGLPSCIYMPHSRWNDLPENDVAGCGYRILTRLKDGGVDTFVRKGKSMSLFFQGHPEYESDTLLLEYRRDLARYLRHESDICPAVPGGHFDRATSDKLTMIRARSAADRKIELLADFPIVALRSEMAAAWHPIALRIYTNWLGYLSARKQAQFKQRPYRNRSEDANLKPSIGCMKTGSGDVAQTPVLSTALQARAKVSGV